MAFPLSKLTHEFGRHEVDAKTGMEEFHAPTPHTFIQAAGYLKHTRARKHGKGVFFRGQTCLYPKMAPTLLRGITDGPTSVKRRATMKAFIDSVVFDRKAMRAVPPFCHEALLQHYGVKTTWLDVVDNIWVALWFACHRALTIGRSQEYLHFERRPLRNSCEDDDQFAYVALLESAYFSSVEDEPGHWRDDRSETIDLRIAAPSQFIRPHAQHGILIRRLSHKGLPVCDFSPLLVGVIRVELRDALDWIGSATTLSSHSLFPPAFYDYGYRELLEHVHPVSGLGCIHRVQT